jgi:hypothetical protein
MSLTFAVSQKDFQRRRRLSRDMHKGLIMQRKI